jgi:predicted DNA-binding protein
MKGSPGRKQFLLRLPHDLFDSTKSYADKENLSITRYINRAIEAYIEATDEVDKCDKIPSSRSSAGWWMD